MWKFHRNIIVFLLLFNCCYSQNYFQKLLYGVGTITSIFETPNKDYLISGTLNYTYDGYLMKLDSSFNPIWTKYFPGHTVGGIIKISNGSYFGVVNNPSIPFTSSHFFKFDLLGNITFIKSYSVNTFGGAQFGNIVQSSTNRLIVGGNVFGGGNPNDWFVTSMDTSANINWAKRYGGWSADDGGQVTALPNGEIIVTGEPESGNVLYSNQNLGIIKLDSLGNYIWGKDFGSSFGEFGLMSKLTSDGLITFLGYGYDSIYSVNCPIVGKFNLSGNLVWIKKYYFKGAAVASNFDEDPTGNLIFVGAVNDTVYGNSVNVSKCFSFSIDKNGNRLWAKSYGDTIFPYDFSRLYNLKIDSRKNLLMVGSKPINLNTNTYAGAFIKADLQGNTYCKEKNLSFSSFNPVFFYSVFDSSSTVPITTIAPISYSSVPNYNFSITCIPATISASINNATICVGNCTSLLATINGGILPFTYSWNPNIGNSAGPLNVCPNKTTQYTLTVKDKLNQTFTSISTVTVNNVIANVAVSPTNGAVPLKINLNNQSVGSTNYNILFGDYSTNSFVPQYIYNNVGTYTLTFIASDNLGCSDSLNFLIEVVPVCQIENKIPNIFTPNNDDVNDVFKFNLCGSQNINCKIYNRWGILIAEIDKPNGFWDGHTTSGEECSDGVYFYILEFSYQGQTKKIKGFIQLSR